METLTPFNIDTVSLTAEISYLKNYAKRFTSDRNDIDDIVQDTILRAFHYAGKFKKGTNFRAWLSAILKNIYINHYRKEKLNRLIMDRAEAVSEIWAEQKILNLAERKFVLKSIQTELNNLPGDLQQMIAMHLLGYKYREIAMCTGKKLGTVKNWIHQGRKELKHALAFYKYSA